MGHKLNVVDSSDLTDSDWAAVNRVNRAYEAGGIDAFWDELERLGNGDWVFQITIASAFFPTQIRAALMDVMADYGLTMEDLRETLEKGEGLARHQPNRDAGEFFGDGLEKNY